ncbi:MAG: hypothetical protein N3G22_04675 [Candidatus Micrarchaeota archaeon]|nr:hypothetical protein [Candidatus Micrarchaeota archaeon]
MAEIRLLLAEEFERKGVKLFNDYYSQERRHYQEEVFENMFLSDYSAKEPAKLNINAISQRISKMRGVFDAGIYHATAALLYLSAAETLPRSEKSNSQIISAYEKAEKSLFAASLIFKNALCLPDSFALRLLEPIGIKVRVGSVEEIKKDIQVKLRLFDFQPAPPSEK